MPNDDLTLLIYRMFYILENAGEWVAKDSQRFFIINPVMEMIRFGFLRIPFELETHSPEIISRRSGGSSIDQYDAGECQLF
jgi:hypothetical protein